MIVNNKLEFLSIYCIHIVDEVLSHILKEVRKCQSVDGTKINKTKISLNYIAMGTRIDVSGASLKEFIELAAGNDREAYIRKKSDQISNLGVIGNRYSGRLVDD